MNQNKKGGIALLVLVGALLCLCAAATAVIDPFFHYHAPLEQLEYPIDNQRYQNDGIVKNFSYDALITGTSMTENFKTTEFDRLFGVHSVKVAFSGATFQELNANLQNALEANPELKLVLYCLDEWFLLSGRDMILADGEYPTYLYDDNPINDVNYLLNKEILFSDTLEVLNYTRQGKTTTSFDDYSSWESSDTTYSAEAVLANYQRRELSPETASLTPELSQQLTDTLQGTLMAMAREYPDTQFILYFPPYSILNWDNHIRQGTLEQKIQEFTLASALLLQVENIQLYAFCDDYQTITDLSNYRDTVHHCAAVNSLILRRIRDGQYRLTAENYRDYWQEVQDYYSAYDYEALLSEAR